MNRTNRYTATNLGPLLKAQGRHQRWLASQLGISDSLMSKVILGQRTIDEALAQRVATLLGVDLYFVFVLHERSENDTQAEALAS